MATLDTRGMKVVFMYPISENGGVVDFCARLASPRERYDDQPLEHRGNGSGRATFAQVIK